jgi:hypothetical protein
MRARKEATMRKLGLMAAAGAAITVIAACGGSTKTVTVTASTPSAPPSTTSPSGASGGAASSAVASCFKAAGAAVRVAPAGEGTAVYAVTRDSGNIGFLKGPSASIALDIARVFSSGGASHNPWTTEPIKNDPTAFVMHQGTLTSADSALLSKCAK